MSNELWCSGCTWDPNKDMASKKNKETCDQEGYKNHRVWKIGLGGIFWLEKKIQWNILG